jgi:hypothetical protein
MFWPDLAGWRERKKCHLSSSSSVLPESLPKSIEYFIEDQTFSPSYNFDIPYTNSPSQQVVSLLSLPVCRRSSLLTGDGGEGVGEEPNHTTARNSGPL